MKSSEVACEQRLVRIGRKRAFDVMVDRPVEEQLWGP